MKYLSRFVTYRFNVSREGFAIEKDYLSDESFESFTINRILLLGLNLLTLLGLAYFTLILILNTSNLYLLYDTIPISLFQIFLTVLLIITTYINTKLIRGFSEEWKAISVIMIIHFLLSFVQGIILYKNPTTLNLLSLSIPGVMTQAEFWMILFYPLMVIFYIVPIIALIRDNQSLDDNIKFSLILFLSSFGLMLYAQGSKIWNTTGWTINMISYDLNVTVNGGLTVITDISNFNISAIGYSMVFLSMILFITGIIILLRDIQLEPNSIYTLIPYIFLFLILGIDYIFSKVPYSIRLLNTGVIVVWFIIGVIYTVTYTLIPNSLLNGQLKDKSKFTPNIKSRFQDKKIETQILDAIEENQINKIIEISSFLGLPYHKVLRSLKNSILQGYISGRILNQQFISVGELHSFEQSHQIPEFPSPFEIWKITMRNEGVISIADLSAIMTLNLKDLEIALTKISASQHENKNFLEGYVYIQNLSELESLYSQILENLPQVNNSNSLNTNSKNNN